MASTIGPLLPGRIPGSLRVDRLKETINLDTRILTEIQDRIASGQEFFRPGESPAAAIRSIILQSELEQISQFKTNIQTDRSFLSASEAALASVSEALNKARTLSQAGIGDTASQAEKDAIAEETAALLKSVLNTANSSFRGRFLFGGSESTELPFELIGNGSVLYRGDELSLDSYFTAGFADAINVDGNSAFQVLTEPLGEDIDPALTLSTNIRDLLGGEGVELGSIVVTLDNGTPQVQTVDLTGAETIGDLKTRLEDAFATGPLTLTVDVDPGTNSGLRLTPSAGTVSVADINGGLVAADLGIAGGPVAQITGGDLDPALTEQTLLSSLNGGTGIGPTAGNGLLVHNGDQIDQVVDLSGATTVEDVLNLLRDPDLSLSAEIAEDRRGLAVSTRLAGAEFSIGENNGSNAANLGLLSFDANTLLSDLNFGNGVPVDDGLPLEITRRDGSTVQVDLSGSVTVQDVLDAINAVDPGNLVASLKTAGNGFSLLDNSGTGPLTVIESVLSEALGLDGSETGSDNTVPLEGTDVSYQRSEGVFGLLTRLEAALRAGDNFEIGNVADRLDDELNRFNLVRADLGSRLQSVDSIEESLLDQELESQIALSEEFDVDMVEAITELTHKQQSLEATYRIASSVLGLSLLDFL